MNIVSIDTRDRLLKTFTILTAVATVLALSGVAYLAPTALGATPADYGLTEGDTISAAGSDDPDVYIVNEMGYKRLFLNPAIFGLYGHLGGFAAVKSVSPATRDAFPTSGLFRVDGDEKVYGLETTGEDVANLRWVNTSGAQAVADDPNFFKKVFVINAAEKALYSTGADFTSVTQVPAYVRGGSVPAPTPSGPLSASVAPGNPAAQTITKNATGVEMLRVRLSGTGTVNTMTVKRLGAGETDDFNNIYIYDGATRLVSGKSFSTSSGEATFLVDVPVNGTKDLSIVAEMASTNTAGNVNYVQLSGVTLSGGASVSGLPVSGNNFTSSGASSGTATIAKSGVLNNPTVGQKQALVSEFKLSVATEGGNLKRLTMLNGGTVDASNLTNVKLKTGASEWSGSVTSDNYFVFDLGSGHFIAKGGNSIFKVYADVGGKKDETINLYFEYDTDTNVVGDQYGQAMAVSDGALDQASDNTAGAGLLTSQGGVLTLVFNGPNATTIPTTVTDTTLLRYSITAASNVEVRKTRLVLCSDAGNDGTYNASADETLWDDLTDVKIWDEDLNTVIAGPKDGTAFDDTNNTTSCPDAATGAEEAFTDVYDLVAGKTYNFKVTGDMDTSLEGTLTDTDSVFKVVLRDHSANTGITEMKYSGTNTALAAADIIPRADLAGNNVTISASSLTLSLAGAPASQTKVKGTQNVDVVGITFAANQASGLLVNQIKLTGYAADTTTYDEGVEDGGTAVSVANAMSNVELWDASAGTMIGGSGNVTSNQLSVSGTGTITFSSLGWNIPAGTSKTLLVRADLSSNAVSGTSDLYSFDIAATGDVTATDDDSNTVNPGAASAGVNGGLSPTKVLTVKGSGAMTLATSADSPSKGAVYWGQMNAPISKFRLSATDEGQYIEKLTFAASVGTEKTDAAANVKNVILTYKNKAGSTLTTTQSFGNAASVNFAWSSSDANRPYVPQDGSMDVAVNADMKLKSEGATQDSSSAVFFSLDLVDKFNGSVTNGFKAVGEGSGTVLSGSSTNINDVLGANDQYVYRVFPEFAQVALPSPYTLTGTPTVFKFTITAKGLSGSNLRFDNEASPGSGSLKFEVVSSGQYTVGGTSTAFSIYDENNTLIDNGTLTRDAKPSPNASMTFDFSSVDVEIAAGNTKTFRVEITNPTTNYAKTTSTGRAADYFQVTLLDNEASLINWVGDYAGANTALDTASTVGTLKSLPLYGPTFQR